MTVHSIARPVVLCLALTVFAGGFSTVSGAPAAASAKAAAGSKLAALRTALAKADRLTIAPASTDGTTPTVRELQGAEAVGEFFEQAEIDESYGPVRCGAPDDAQFTFYAGDKVLATLSLRRLGYLSWKDGPWNGDAVLTPAGSQRLLVWSRATGADISLVIQRLATATIQRTTQARQRFIAAFTPDARAAFAQGDAYVYQGRLVRRVKTEIGELYDNKNALADACFRALAEIPIRWMEDDWGTGAVDNVLLELDPAVVRAAILRLQGEDEVMLGVARFVLRCNYFPNMEPGERDVWAERLADLAFRKGRNTNKHAVLEFLANVPGEKAAAFLRGVAQGEHVYDYAPAYDDVSLNTEEPGLANSAALLLAIHGDAKAAAIVKALRRKPAFGPDQAALDVAEALLSADRLPAASTFSYHSRILGLGAVEVLQRRTAATTPVDVLSAALRHSDPDVSTLATKIAQLSQLRRADEPPDASLLSVNIDSLIAESYPRLAVEQYTALMPKARGQTLARLQTLRAQAYYKLGDYAAAEIDYLNVLKTPFAADTDVQLRLAWVQWYQGEFAVAEQTIAMALEAEPKSDLALLRGFVRYSQNDFRPSTEADLIAAKVLEPSDGYAALFQHLVAILGGRPGQSQLRASLASPEIGDWERQIISFALGGMTPQRLLELAVSSDPSEVAWHLCEANFYISQLERINGRPDGERKFLADCIALNQPNVAEYWVAKFRLAEIRPGSTPSPRAARPPSI